MTEQITHLQSLVNIADEIFERWDKDMRSGKLLTALAGRITQYRKDVTRLREVLALIDSHSVIEEIAAERQRQIIAEGWSFEHDDQHSEFELSRAAVAYARHAANNHAFPHYVIVAAPDAWPWEYAWWKPKDPRRDLVRAAALIVADIERLDRAAAAETLNHGEGNGTTHG